ncbi:general secretion pathway protein [Paralcaligenes ureilyticus]|uniref:General secretion pathway protein n=1 Tax=Paralcaligenes ureilyticus TaxID=627131 RepID=A0A4R3LXN9_9BURK|nr:general secretion pathway protein [Paralcaligenes ureilyticus]TCT05353.1 hypothetical protein EDC26_11093 [Paralcaligenes ureilyticus]
MRAPHGADRLRRSLEQLGASLDAWRFRAGRADYYDYLSALMDSMQGRRTLLEIFQSDMRRYGHATVRGRLSQRWVQAYPMTGGDLYLTWAGCFPANELGLIRVAQASGNAPLVHTLRDLSDAVRLIRQAHDILTTTLWSAVLALAMLAALVLAVPLFTVPQLRHTFNAVPPEYYAALTRRLFGFASLVQGHWLFATVFFLGAILLLLWSLPNLTGRIRHGLDRYFLWRIYRQVHAIGFLSVLTIVLERPGAGSTQLRAALAMQRAGASAWVLAHLDAMLARIDIGLVGADTFDTGLFDRELFWFLSDMAMARGLGEGLALTRGRLKSQVLSLVARQALVLRWALLLSCVAGLLSLGLWHYAVIDELRRSLMFFYASQ